MRPGQVCDGIMDCKDGTDEAQCREEDFRECGSGSRIHRSYWCDGWPDCQDNHADELHCWECHMKLEYECPNSRCISVSNVCDSQCDCVPDCEDESNCNHTLYNSIQGSTLCEVGSSLTCLTYNLDRSQDRCIAPQYICDQKNDCHNGDILNDEFGCVLSGVCPSTSHFSCSDGRCMPNHLRCDHKPDCLSGDDEEHCSMY
ncbi:unnamed protein product [Meganyctiphanes norvegica]|uniref:Uncharacterized protein n=1 Tax=Meganyctiphanes norvegica TaxID=48144 RepID=A0AAV2Q4Q6_MEGNR